MQEFVHSAAFCAWCFTCLRPSRLHGWQGGRLRSKGCKSRRLPKSVSRVESNRKGRWLNKNSSRKFWSAHFRHASHLTPSNSWSLYVEIFPSSTSMFQGLVFFFFFSAFFFSASLLTPSSGPPSCQMPQNAGHGRTERRSLNNSCVARNAHWTVLRASRTLGNSGLFKWLDHYSQRNISPQLGMSQTTRSCVGFQPKKSKLLVCQ